MTIPGGIFVRIFFGFWLVTVAILGSWMLAAQYFESIPLATNASNPSGPPPRFMQNLIYSLQNRPIQELPTLLQTNKERHGFDIYLLRRGGADFYGRELLPGVATVSQQIQGRRRRAFLETPDYHLFAHSIYRDEQGPLTAVVAFKPPQRGLLSALGKNLWLRIALAVLVSGVICFALSRAMTNRFKHVQQASKRLARGDLATRITVRETGGDETDELARDFNAMAAQIEQQVQAQKRLLGDVSHELRSPLARLRIALALAQEDADNGPRHLSRIDHEALRLEELIGQLLSSQATDTSLDSHIDLVALLKELCADGNFEGESENKAIHFTTELTDAVVASHADLLKKTFENILRNALKYTPQNSKVITRLVRSQNHYRITIRDQGPGVEESELPRLFDEFYRVDTARPRETGGYGLGLSIAKRAVSAHQGSIHARNTDDGLEIEVVLPIYTE